MNKNTICTLLLGTTLIGCNSPIETKSDGTSAIYVPMECDKIKALVHIRGNNWSLTCKNVEGKEIFYERYGPGEYWRKYEMVRK